MNASSMSCVTSGSSGGMSVSAASTPLAATMPHKSPANIVDTIRHVEGQIASYGPGPHTPLQQQELVKLSNFLQRARIEQQKMMNVNKHMENSMGAATVSPMMGIPQTAANIRPAPMQPQPQPSPAASASGGESRVLDKRRLQELVKEVDPLEQLDDDVEDVLLQIADDFIENVVSSSCQIAKHRKSNSLEVKDVQLYLERSWNMWVPGYGSDDIRPFKKASVTEAHKQRMALIRKTLKKY